MAVIIFIVAILHVFIKDWAREFQRNFEKSDYHRGLF